MFGLWGAEKIDISFIAKLRSVPWGLVTLIVLIASVGFGMQYSVAGGDLDPWAGRQMVRFGIGLAIFFAVAMIDIRIWMVLAYPLYSFAIILLIAVELVGRIGMGAQRWLDLGFIQLQPSEIMKISIVLALARYFHGLSYEEVGKFRNLIPPIIMALMPFVLVIFQPDLGTAITILLGAIAAFWLAGVRIWKFALATAAGLALLPIAWQFLHDYQKKRVLTFLDPEADPLGSGYHIMQSKIALGSGGLLGKGYMQGTQSHLNFLPEKQTDFIFTSLAEEFGMAGGLVLIALYVAVITWSYAIAFNARSQFARLVGVGVGCMLFIYVFINIAMVTGLLPVVGIPLPMVSYGGTAMMTLLIALGLLMSVHIHAEVEIPRAAGRLGF